MRIAGLFLLFPLLVQPAASAEPVHSTEAEAQSAPVEAPPQSADYTTLAFNLRLGWQA